MAQKDQNKSNKAKIVKPAGTVSPEQQKSLDKNAKANLQQGNDNTTEGGSYVEQSQNKQKAATKEAAKSKAQASITQGDDNYRVDGDNWNRLTVEDFHPELVYHTADAAGNINPRPIVPTGNLAKDTRRFQDEVLNRKGAFVPKGNQMAKAYKAMSETVVQARPSEIQRAREEGKDAVKGETQSGVSGGDGKRYADGYPRRPLAK